jgi:hypothetical protein
VVFFTFKRSNHCDALFCKFTNANWFPTPRHPGCLYCRSARVQFRELAAFPDRVGMITLALERADSSAPQEEISRPWQMPRNA